MKANLNGKVALVFGSTYGVGEAIALKLARNGADVVINGRNTRAGIEVTKSIEQLGRRAIFEKGDVYDYRETRRVADSAIEKLGGIDIMVASGGGLSKTERLNFFREINPEDYVDEAIRGWISRLYCVRAVLDHMVERQAGKMILISSDGGRWPTPGESLVCGAAAAVVMMTRVLAKEFTRWQIRLNTICVTVIKDTKGLETVIKESPSAAKIFKEVLETQPFPTTTKDIAETALFLASEESNQITGQTLSVNGGVCFP